MPQGDRTADSLPRGALDWQVLWLLQRSEAHPGPLPPETVRGEKDPQLRGSPKKEGGVSETFRRVMSAKQVLNSSLGGSDGLSRPAEQLSIDLQRHMLAMKGDFLSMDGHGVNYAGLFKSDAFKNYTETAGELRSVDLTTCTEEQRKAFFISIRAYITLRFYMYI